MLDGGSISFVLDAYRPERGALLQLLAGLSGDDWDRSTECPAYTVKGVATHVLGDDLSLLSRQRDAAVDGLTSLRVKMPDADFRTLLDTFNDRWVTAAEFLSPALLMALLRLTGDLTEDYYRSVDPNSPGESVGFFGAPQGQPSPFWQAIAREYMERWIHHSQIRRALGLGSLANREFITAGVEVVAAVGKVEPFIPSEEHGDWGVGQIVLGSASQTADILTRGHTSEEIRRLVRGPDEHVNLLSLIAGRP